MCNRTAGLVAREIERGGIPTVTLSIQRQITEAVRPPRALFLAWPFGRSLGEPGQRNQQLHVLLAALDLFDSAREPGTIVAPDWPWRRTRYDDPLMPGSGAPVAPDA